MKLTKQQKKVYDYILKNPGCTTHDIMRDTFVQCPSGRISELRNAGVKIVSVGKKKFPGANAFEMYAVREPLMKTVSQIFLVDGVAVERRVQVAV